MIHKPWSWGMGDAKDFRKMAETLDVLEEGLVNVYAENLLPGVDIETIKQMIQDETWLTGEQAAQYFDIELSEDIEAVAYTDIEFENAPRHMTTKSAQQRNEEMQKKQQQQQYAAKLKLIKMKGVVEDE
jgi:hypothetical protein